MIEKVTLKSLEKQLEELVGIYTYSYTLTANEEVSFTIPSYGIANLTCGELGCSAFFLLSSYQNGYVGQNGYKPDNPSVGDIGSGRDIEFGRKEVNGSYYVKNNTWTNKNVIIIVYRQ